MATTDVEQYVVFRVGPTLCAVPSIQVEHIAEAPQRFTRLPLAPPGVVGVFEYRSEVGLAVCLHRKFGLRTVRSAGSGVLLVGRLDDEAVGLWADEVLDIVAAPLSERIPMPLALPDTVFDGFVLRDGGIVLTTEEGSAGCRALCRARSAGGLS